MSDIPEGTRVRLVGLKNPDLNEQYGVVTGYSKGGDRVMVSLESGPQGVVKVKPSHLEIVEEAAPSRRRDMSRSSSRRNSGGKSGMKRVSSSESMSSSKSQAGSQDIVDALHDADALFNLADVSGDGYVSKQEFEFYMKRKTKHSNQVIREIFGMMDADRSGSVSREEVRKVFLRAKKMRKNEPVFGSGRSLMDSPSATVGDTEIFQCAQDADRLFREADTSGDGVVSKKEFELYMKRHTKNPANVIHELFNMMDVDDDGYITVDEVRKAFMHQNRKRLAADGKSVGSSGGQQPKLSMAELLGLEDEDLHEISDDAYNMFFLSPIGGQAFWYALIIFVIKIALFIIIAIDLLDKKGFPSESVEMSVKMAQFLLLPVAVAIEEELITTFFVYGNLKWSSEILELNPGAKKWKYHVANLARFFDGLLFLVINTILLFQAVDILSMFLNFAALMFLQTIDNVALHLARDGYLTDTLEQVANDVTLMKLPRNHNETLQVMDTVGLMVVLFILVVFWVYVHFVLLA